MPVYCGLDFGTSNTAISLLCTDANGNVLEHKIIAVEPSVIYFPAGGIFNEAYYVGNEAIEKYIQDNMKGRLIKSIKSLLPYSEYKYTIINKKPYQPDDILMWIFRHFKKQVELYLAEQQMETEITGTCIGRPVYFSEDAESDQLAEKRIMNAAHMAGFKEYHLVFEPVAALYGYHLPVRTDDIILMADLGAGTSDFTLIENYQPGQVSAGDCIVRENFVSEGIHTGGDDFDTALFLHKITKHFGQGTRYESWGKWLVVPEYIYFQISNWVQLNQLKTIKFLEQLKEIKRSSNHKTKIQNLITLIESNLAYPLFKAIEAAKISLSSREIAGIRFSYEGNRKIGETAEIDINEVISLQGFNRIIEPEVKKIGDTVNL